MADLLINRNAQISLCGLYRYRLTRIWSAAWPLTFVMLNPSTADDKIDDPTIRRCMSFARRDGYGGIVVVNAYAFRATSPKDLWKAADPFGPENDLTLLSAGVAANVNGTPVVCAWGVHGASSNRHIALLLQAGADLRCLGVTKEGHPRHPLYVKGDRPLESFRG